MAPNPLFYATILATLCIKGLNDGGELTTNLQPGVKVMARRVACIERSYSNTTVCYGTVYTMGYTSVASVFR